MKKTLHSTFLMIATFLGSAAQANASSFYCLQGSLYNENSEEIAHIGEQKSCLESVINRDFFCRRGMLHQKQGFVVESFHSQAECLSAVRGKFYCRQSVLHNLSGEALNAFSTQEECLRSVLF